jgi:hypothetical protein
LLLCRGTWEPDLGKARDIAKRLERFGRGLIPIGLRMAAKASWNLERRYGHYRTAKLGACVDADGAPIPWYTYPALEYLRQLDFSGCDVFEFGSGNSTLYWGARCRRLFSVEDDPAWHKAVAPKIAANTIYMFEPDADRYVTAIARSGARFDGIAIDGSVRKRCAEIAVNFLKPGGLVILDNSDWFPNTAALLRQAGLIQVDMHGFGPINAYTWTTSLFLQRGFGMKPIEGRQPSFSRCAVRVVKD